MIDNWDKMKSFYEYIQSEEYHNWLLKGKIMEDFIRMAEKFDNALKQAMVYWDTAEKFDNALRRTAEEAHAAHRGQADLYGCGGFSNNYAARVWDKLVEIHPDSAAKRLRLYTYMYENLGVDGFCAYLDSASREDWDRMALMANLAGDNRPYTVDYGAKP